MRQILAFILMLSAVAITLAACGNSQKEIDEPAAIHAAWQALDPYTSSHNQAYWQAVTVRRDQGANVAKEFRGAPIGSGCWGPTPTPNASITPNTNYWYVVMQKKAMTAVPKTRVSPTEPPMIPDWNIAEAYFLIDPSDGRVIAKSIRCIII